MTALTAEQWRTKYRKEISRLQSKLNDCAGQRSELESAIHRLPKPPDHIGDGPDERVTHALNTIEEQKAGLVEVLAMLDYYLTDDNRAAWGLASRTTRNAFREQVNDEWVRDIIDAGVEAQSD